MVELVELVDFKEKDFILFFENEQVLQVLQYFTTSSTTSSTQVLRKFYKFY